MILIKDKKFFTLKIRFNFVHFLKIIFNKIKSIYYIHKTC